MSEVVVDPGVWNRWYLLRHPDPWPAAMFENFVAQARIWRAIIEATCIGWEHLSAGRLGTPVPTYVFGEPHLDDTRRTAVLAVGGDIVPAAFNLLEESFPKELHMDFPLWFRVDLELGRRDLLGHFAEPHFHPALDPKLKEELRDHPMFRREPP